MYKVEFEDKLSSIFSIMKPYKYTVESKVLKTVAFIVGKKNAAIQKKNIPFLIEIKPKNDFKGEIVSKIQFRPN